MHARSATRGVNQGSLLRYELGKAREAVEIPMDPIRAVNKQLTVKAA